MGELVAGLYFGRVGGRSCCFATAVTEAAAVADSDLAVIILFVLRPSFGLYSCGLVVAAAAGATLVGVQWGIFIVGAVQIPWNAANAL